jgi:thioredoxin-related protein
MLDSHNNRVAFVFIFFLLALFFSIDFLLLCFFWQPVSFFLLGAFSRLLLSPDVLALATSIMLLGLQASLSGLDSKNFMLFLIMGCFLGSLVKKTVYNTHALQVVFSGCIVVYYMVIMDCALLSSWHTVAVSLSYTISALFAADRITKITKTTL